ncbi:hypothetical protein LXL04_030051 [Taraxacum kok-saghyz]
MRERRLNKRDNVFPRDREKLMEIIQLRSEVIGSGAAKAGFQLERLSNPLLSNNYQQVVD